MEQQQPETPEQKFEKLKQTRLKQGYENKQLFFECENDTTKLPEKIAFDSKMLIYCSFFEDYLMQNQITSDDISENKPIVFKRIKQPKNPFDKEGKFGFVEEKLYHKSCFEWILRLFEAHHYNMYQMQLVVPVMRFHQDKDKDYYADWQKFHDKPKQLARQILLERHVKDEHTRKFLKEFQFPGFPRDETKVPDDLSILNMLWKSDTEQVDQSKDSLICELIELIADKLQFGGKEGGYQHSIMQEDVVSTNPFDHDELIVVVLKCAQYEDHFERKTMKQMVDLHYFDYQKKAYDEVFGQGAFEKEHLSEAAEQKRKEQSEKAKKYYRWRVKSSSIPDDEEEKKFYDTQLKIEFPDIINLHPQEAFQYEVIYIKIIKQIMSYFQKN